MAFWIVVELIEDKRKMTKEGLIKNQFPNDEFLQSAVLQIVDKCVAELKKENSALREQLNKHPCVRKDYYCSDCLKDIEKAKELISKLSQLKHRADDPFTCDEYTKLIKEAEQFLKEFDNGNNGIA